MLRVLVGRGVSREDGIFVTGVVYDHLFLYKHLRLWFAVPLRVWAGGRAEGAPRGFPFLLVLFYDLLSALPTSALGSFVALAAFIAYCLFFIVIPALVALIFLKDLFRELVLALVIIKLWVCREDLIAFALFKSKKFEAGKPSLRTWLTVKHLTLGFQV